MSHNYQKIKIGGLHFHAFHGCFPEEREEGNFFIVSLEIEGINLQKSAETDALEDTLDYSVVCHKVEGVMKGETHNLLETLCRKMILSIKEYTGTESKVKVKLRKLNPRVGVPCKYTEIEWHG